MPEFSTSYVLQEVDPKWLTQAVKPKQFLHIDQAECILCEGCVDICPWKCIHMLSNDAIDEAVNADQPGDDPQDKKYAGERTKLVIGDRNTIREFCTLNRGTVQDAGVTTIGNDNWIMAYCHVAHDCVVGSNTIFANNASIAGHVRVGDYAILGGFTAVHQFCRIGAHSMASMFSYLTKDVPAYVMVSGRPAEPRDINAEGLKRRNFTADQIRNIREAYRVVYRQELKLDEAIAQLTQLVAEQPEIKPFVDSLRDGSRGLAR